MNSQPLFILLGMVFFVVVVGFLIAIGYLVYASVALRRAVASFSVFLKETEDRLNPLVEETEQTLKSLRKVTDDVGVVTDSARNLSVALYETADNVRVVSSLINDLRGGVSLRVLGVKSGLRAALEVLAHEIKKNPFGTR